MIHSNYLKVTLFALFLTVGLVSTASAAQNQSEGINIHSPTTTEINGMININATNPEGYPKGGEFYLIDGPVNDNTVGDIVEGNINSDGSYNGTYNTTRVQNGKYNLTFYQINSNKDITIGVKPVAIDNSGTEENSISVDLFAGSEGGTVFYNFTAKETINSYSIVLEQNGDPVRSESESNLDNKWIAGSFKNVTEGDYSLDVESVNSVEIHEDKLVSVGSSSDGDNETYKDNETDGGYTDNDTVRFNYNITGFEAEYDDGALSFDIDAEGNLSEVVIRAPQIGDLPADDIPFSINEDFGPSLEHEGGGEYEASIGEEKDIPLPEGSYEFALVAANGLELESPNKSILVVGGQSSVLDDLHENTSTDYYVESAFKGHELNLTKSSGMYSLIDNQGSVEQTVDASTGNKFSTSGLSEGRYTLNSSEGTLTEIDVLDSTHDVVSRVSNFSSQPDVTVYEYRTADKIDVGNDNRVNVTTPTSWSSGEYVFRMDTSLKFYWVEISTQDKTIVKASRFAQDYGYEPQLETCEEEENEEETDSSSGGSSGDTDDDLETTETNTSGDSNVSECGTEQLEMPYVEDYSLEEDRYNISGKVTNGTKDYSDVQVALKGFEPGYGMKFRDPFYVAPPTITAMTDENGEFTFTNIPEGRYKFELQNDSFVREDVKVVGEQDYEWSTKGDPLYQEDVNLRSNKSVTIVGTDNTGKVNLTIDRSGDSFYYGYRISKYTGEDYYSYEKPGIGNGSVITLPEGNYDITAAAVPKTENGNYRDKALQRVNVTKGDTVDRNATFAGTVYLNGTVTPSSLITDGYAYVSVRKKGSFENFYTRVGNDGSYSVRVPENSNYTVKFNPPYDSSFTRQEDEIWIKETGATLDFNLKSGNSVTGEITTSGEEEVEAEVRIANYSKDIYQRQETEGKFNISGLENGSYRLDVEPESQAYNRYTNDSIVINGSSVSLGEIDISGTNAFLTGQVKVIGDSTEDIEVSVYGERVFKEEEIKPNGTFNFSLPTGVKYKVNVYPEDENLKFNSKSVRLDKDGEAANFKLEEPETFDGYVKSGEEGVEAFVYAYNRSRQSYDSTKTDEDGKFELNVQNVSHIIEIWPKPDEDVTYKEANVTAENVTNDRLTNFTYESENLTYLSGKIKDSFGQGVEGAIGVWNESERSFKYQEVESDGNFNLTGLKSVYHNVWVRPENETIPIKRSTVNLNETNSKDFSVGDTETNTLLIQTDPAEAGFRVETSNAEKETNSTGHASFEISGTTTDIKIDRSDYKSKVMTAEIDRNSNVDERPEMNSLEVSYRVDINVTEAGTDELSVPVSVVFSSRENSSTKSKTTVLDGNTTTEEFTGLPSGDYLAGVAEGPESAYENTEPNIPENSSNADGHSETVDLKDSKGNVQYNFEYEVTKE